MLYRYLVALLALSGCDAVLRLDRVAYKPDASVDAPADAAPDAPPDAPPMCPSSYAITRLASSYRLAPNPVVWLAAVQDCASDETRNTITGHTHLAVINGVGERDFLYGLNFGWIGLSDLKTQGTWRWVTADTGAIDPSASNTNLWATGEPNNLTTEMCAHFDSGHPNFVNNVTCTEVHVYMCECDDSANDPSTYQ